MSRITLRRDKGSALTYDEMDDNFALLSGGILGGVAIANTAPENPVNGELWLDTGTTQRTFAWDAGGQQWIDISPSNKTTISETEPANPLPGDGWFNTSIGGSGTLVLWNGEFWIQAI